MDQVYLVVQDLRELGEELVCAYGDFGEAKERARELSGSDYHTFLVYVAPLDGSRPWSECTFSGGKEI